MKRGFCCAVFSLLLAGTAGSAPLVQEGFDDYQIGVRPAGWTFNGCSADSDVYTSSGNFGLASPSIKLDATGDSVTTAAFAGAGALSFWVRGVSINPSSSLLVEEYYGSAWGTVTDIVSLPGSGTTIGLLALNPSSSQLKFTYTKVAGNLGFDDVAVFAITTTATTTTGTTTTAATTTGTTTTGSTTTSGPTTSTTTTAVTCDPVYEGFDDYEIGVRPAGWTFNGCSSDSDVYTSSGNFGLASPSIKLDATGDSITTAVFGPGCSYDLSFWIRGVATGAGSSLLVEEFYASAWVPLTDIAALPTTGTVIGALRLNPSSAQVRFTYTKSSGNLAFDDFFLDPPPTPTPSASTTPSLPPTPTPTATPGKTPTPTPEGYKTPSSTPTPVPTASVTPTAPCGPDGPDDYLVMESSDYNGDGVLDVALYRPDNGLWAVRGVTAVYYGTGTDRPVPGDYDGDYTTDIGVFRDGRWLVRNLTRFFYGRSGDRPLPVDYNGDGRVDPAVFRPSTGAWMVKGVTRFWFGEEDDFTVPGHFAAQPAFLPAIFRPSTGLWRVRNLTRAYLGQSGDWPAVGDYEGDSVWEITVFRPSTGLWAVRWVTRVWFGQCRDRPVNADYDGDGIEDPGIFRPSSGLWTNTAGDYFYFGRDGDLPLTR